MIRFPDIHSHHIQNNGFQLINQTVESFDSSVEYFSIGWHPWAVENYNDADFETLIEYAQLPNCKAIGECGLDKNISTSLEKQLPIFEKQLQLAFNLNKPAILHCVKAFQEIVNVCTPYLGKIPLIIHGFNKNTILAKQLIDKGFYISLGQSLVYKKDLASLPLESLVLETDDAIFPIKDLYQIIADYQSKDIEVIEKQIVENVTKILKLV